MTPLINLSQIYLSEHEWDIKEQEKSCRPIHLFAITSCSANDKCNKLSSVVSLNKLHFWASNSGGGEEVLHLIIIALIRAEGGSWQTFSQSERERQEL